MSGALLDQLRQAPEQLGPFALLLRAGNGASAQLELLAGDIQHPQRLADIDLPPATHPGHWALALLPFRQVAERGFDCVDDGEPLRVMQVRQSQQVDLHSALADWPSETLSLGEGTFDIDDQAYAERVRRIVEDEIHHGEGSNFVIRRTYRAPIDGCSLRGALGAFKRLALQEQGAYWTFLVHDGERTWLGASPERHVALRDGIASMNPISGTYRYPPSGVTQAGLVEFLGNRKESDELYMVVDEELKMMARFCDQGTRVIGPKLKMMSRLAHTEYLLEGPSRADPRDILRDTLFSPAVTGSPIQNACRVIARHEPEGRGTYAGVLALFGRDRQGQHSLDSSILIRTAEIRGDGQLRLAVGATIVRHSDPQAEALETWAKARGVLDAFQRPQARDLAQAPAVLAALAQRNQGISRYWLGSAQPLPPGAEALRGRRLLIVDAEDSFTGMLAQQLQALGLVVEITRASDPRVQHASWDLALFGPGPGDPENHDDLRIGALAKGIQRALEQGRPFLAVCLSHQLLCRALKLPVRRLAQPNQGLQRCIDYFGTPQRVGFYNTFSAFSERDLTHLRGHPVRICRDRHSGEVHALRGPGFASTQFHPESLLTEHGPHLLLEALLGLIETPSTASQELSHESL